MPSVSRIDWLKKRWKTEINNLIINNHYLSRDFDLPIQGLRRVQIGIRVVQMGRCSTGDQQRET